MDAFVVPVQMVTHNFQASAKHNHPYNCDQYAGMFMVYCFPGKQIHGIQGGDIVSSVSIRDNGVLCPKDPILPTWALLITKQHGMITQGKLLGYHDLG